MLNRSEYTRGTLTPEQLLADPIEQLRLWVSEAQAHPSICEPNAMCVSTVSGAGQPSARFVLLRQILPEGLVFFTNYKSRKGRDIDHDPRVAATFWWGELERQIRVEGLIARTSEELSDAYFHSRPRDSQLASAASPQSREVDSREELEEALRDMERRFPEEVERPDHWGGYIITPHAVEFWQGRRARMHDRIQYRLEGTTWTKVRLAP